MSDKFYFSFLLSSILLIPDIANAQHVHHHMTMPMEEISVQKNQNPYITMMDNMMAQMDAVNIKCCLNMNFLAQMMAHHQGAIDMTEYQIKHGENKQMMALAKSIITEQKAEYKEMQALLDYFKANKKSAKLTNAYNQAMNKTMIDMMKNMPKDLTDKSHIDKSFALVMIPHHQAAIDMSVALMNFNADPMLIKLANKIIADQQVEINLMQEFLNK